jgi:hypothetical protein
MSFGSTPTMMGGAANKRPVSDDSRGGPRKRPGRPAGDRTREGAHRIGRPCGHCDAPPGPPHSEHQTSGLCAGHPVVRPWAAHEEDYQESPGLRRRGGPSAVSRGAGRGIGKLRGLRAAIRPGQRGTREHTATRHATVDCLADHEDTGTVGPPPSLQEHRPRQLQPGPVERDAGLWEPQVVAAIRVRRTHLRPGQLFAALSHHRPVRRLLDDHEPARGRGKPPSRPAPGPDNLTYRCVLPVRPLQELLGPLRPSAVPRPNGGDRALLRRDVQLLRARIRHVLASRRRRPLDQPPVSHLGQHAP